MTSTVLVVITFASLAIAAGMTIVVLRMVREERQRSDARASALGELVARDDRDVDAFEPPVVRPVRRASAAVTRPAPPAISDIPRVEDGRDLDLHRDVSGVADLFTEPERTSPWPGRAAVIGGLAVVAACLALLGTALATPFDTRCDRECDATGAARADVPPLHTGIEWPDDFGPGAEPP